MTDNPYKTLDVPKDATDAEIKKAYQRKAQKLHPDKETGDVEEFQQLMKSYALLKDHEKRRRYDQTGNVDSGPINDPVQQRLVELFRTIVGAEDFTGDIIERSLATVDLAMVNIATRRHDTEHHKGILEKQLGRVESDEGMNLYEGVLTDKITGFVKTLGYLEEEAVIVLKVKERLQHYKDTGEAPVDHQLRPDEIRWTDSATSGKW